MSTRMLWLALGLNVVTSFLGALLYRSFCLGGLLFCGDRLSNHLGIFFPILISGLIIIPIAFVIGRWLKRPLLFLLVVVLLEAIFNSSDESFFRVMRMYLVGVSPALIAAVVGWLMGRSKNPARP